MIKKKEIVAMLLAGGQGSRLYALTSHLAKPAVIYGAKYRIIDFPLSNCINSGIDTVGVLTQYQPLVLNEYIGNGQPWDLDRMFGGVHILPPYQAKMRYEWYKGTANAIYQNIHFIKQYDPDYVLILSGDHIYKMDYSKMLEYHKENNADLTIAVIDVSLEEASRFGIMNTHSNGEIYEFEEKPTNPKSTKASMGIYIFNAETLYTYLQLDEQDETSSNDFGKNIIPRMLKDGHKLMAYTFSGYWKDVGTLDSLMETNMDLLGEEPKFETIDPKWPIYSRTPLASPHYVGNNASIGNSIIAAGCNIDGIVQNSLISNNVQIEKGAIVNRAVIHDNVIIKSGAVVENCIIDSRAVIGENARIGKIGKELTVIGNQTVIEVSQIIEAGQIIEKEYRG